MLLLEEDFYYRDLDSSKKSGYTFSIIRKREHGNGDAHVQIIICETNVNRLKKSRRILLIFITWVSL